MSESTDNELDIDDEELEKMAQDNGEEIEEQ